MTTLDFNFKKEITTYKSEDPKFKELKMFKAVESFTSFYTEKQYRFHLEIFKRKFSKILEQQNRFDELVKKSEEMYDTGLKNMLNRRKPEYKEYKELYAKWKEETKEKKSYIDYCKMVVEEGKKSSKEYLQHQFEENKDKLVKLNAEINLIEEVLEKGSTVLVEKRATMNLEDAANVTDEQIQALLKAHEAEEKKREQGF